MHNRAGDIIYIGKAKALKNRVSQYFGSEKNHDNKVRRMVSNVDWFEYILCDSEFEALVLESSLIKQHKPKYNILLKDDKGYSYVRVSQGPGPHYPGQAGGGGRRPVHRPLYELLVHQAGRWIPP